MSAPGPEGATELLAGGITGSWSVPSELAEPVRARLDAAVSEGLAGRIWNLDESVWGGPGIPEIGNRLGWLDSPEGMQDQVADLESFATECAEDGLRDCVLLGMGGSSLAPEVLVRTFGTREGGLSMRVLDSTDPGAVLAVERAVDLSRTLFLVSTKSGGTIETISLYRHFRSRVDAEVGEGAGSRFAAITDPGSSLADLAEAEGFRRTFLNDPDIGGRYSALSLFGLVPAALIGIDVGGLLASSAAMAEACRGDGPENPGIALGALTGELARHGRDKLTFVTSDPFAAFGVWVEQLVAESTGKEGGGILPVADEPLGPPEEYGDDRVMVFIGPGRAGLSPEWREPAAGDRLATISLFPEAPEDLGALFFLWEFAVAVSGWVLGINPFDQPNVQEAKDTTTRVLEGYGGSQRLDDPGSAGPEVLANLVGELAPPRYLAIMAFLEPSPAVDAAVAELRVGLRRATRAATTFGYGPRFLHSTGQLHKGGPDTGFFLQLVHDGGEDARIPDQKHGASFGVLKNAQAIGDLETLRSHGLRAERVRLEGDPAAGVGPLSEALTGRVGA